MSHATEHPHKCRKCSATTPSGKWGTIKATKAGWYFMRNGHAYCVRHRPDWAPPYTAGGL